MPKICLYFQLHQPYRLRNYSIFEIGRGDHYFSDSAEDDENEKVFTKVAEKSYIPMLSLLNKLLADHPEFHFTLSMSGVFLEQAADYQPRVIKLIRQMVKTGRVEILAETYYHSLSSLYSPAEFKRQVKLHQAIIKKLFRVKPQVFRNTELVYSDDIAEQVASLKFKGILTEGVDRYLHGRPRTQVYVSKSESKIPILLKHAQLSDDIAFRFSDKSWVSYPLHADTYLHWLNSYEASEYVNLFMDFETFGEHQWADTGIFQFFAKMVEQALSSQWNKFVTPSQAFASVQMSELDTYHVPKPISWADIDRDLSAWIDNDLQQDSLKQIYQLETKVLKSRDKKLIDNWRRLQTSDHFYYMCIKWSADGDVHAYFSPYESPNQAYMRYSTVLADLNHRIRKNFF